VGLPDWVDLSDPQTLGFRIVCSLALQLDALLGLERVARGTRCRVILHVA
jgi:two-component sensor histidine kinase